MKVKNVDHELDVTVEMPDGRTFTRHYSSTEGLVSWYYLDYKGSPVDVTGQLAKSLEIEFLKKHASSLKA